MKILFFILVSILNIGRAQVWLHPNRGQWDKEIKYISELKNGQLLVDNKGFTFFFHDYTRHKRKISPDSIIHCQVVQTHFQNASWGGSVSEHEESSFYRNYFLGNEKNNWKTNIHSIKQTTLLNFYEGIDLIIDGSDDKLKYSFLVHPNVNPAIIQKTILGYNNISIQEGGIHISTNFGEIIEEKPVAWTLSKGQKIPVSVEYQLNDNNICFVFPRNYNSNDTLIIDPYLVFSSFSGATADNWGMTATPDSEGNLYAGGIVFSGSGTYPTVSGSFDLSFNGGSTYTYSNGNQTSTMPGFDVAISKFNANGTQLLFSTYLGGSGNEAPHSLVTDENMNLFVMGVTGSTDFPTVNGCFDQTFNGGPTIAENELGYNGSDIFVTRFNALGNALLGSTYVGGDGTDGINIGGLNYNYGDPFRGEIITKNGFVYVSSTTQSNNFPIVTGLQSNLNGVQDAVIFKLNANLTNMLWSTYFGGSGLETGNSLQIASNGNIYVTGGTSSSNLPLNIGNDLSFNGGISDGYVVQLQGANSNLISGTYMGMGDYDQSYFVQLNLDDEVFVYGQTESSWPISNGVYGNPNSGQFIRKYNSSLENILWTTMIGAGTGHPEISPTAFLVSDCDDIYISGWGGTINSSFGNQANFSSSNGFPITSDAYQSVTNGSNFYIAVLAENASLLKYGTYMGGTSSSYNHVDGGTSRFDKSGRIYHAVCGGCGGQDFGFTSTPGVFSPTNNSSNCNLAAFKFELSTIEAVISNPNTVICLPDPLMLTNGSSNGNDFLWDFGDGNSSTDINPSHLYSSPGNYTVSLIVSDSNHCYTPDSTAFEVQIGDFQTGIVPVNMVCPGEAFQLEAFGGSSYYWSPEALLNNHTIANPTAVITENTTFSVIVSDSCGVDTLSITINVSGSGISVSNDTSICLGDSTQLFAYGGENYLWSPSITLDNAASQNPLATPTSTTEYHVQITSDQGCIIHDSLTVTVVDDFPTAVLTDTLILCRGESISIIASGAEEYHWTPSSFIDTSIGCCVQVNPPISGLYFCDFTNACGTVRDSVFINVKQATVTTGNDTIICKGQSAQLAAFGAVSYEWKPATSIENPFLQYVNVHPVSSTIYTVIGIDTNNCIDSAFVLVNLFPTPLIQVNKDIIAMIGEEIQLEILSASNGQIVWSPANFLSCIFCLNPISSTTQPITYQATITDTNGCTNSDFITINFDPIIYIPNTFTPDDDRFNQVFKIIVKNVLNFELIIFNRWGEFLYKMDAENEFWDGNYKEKSCQDDTYVWKLNYTDLYNKKHEQSGHVNILR